MPVVRNMESDPWSITPVRHIDHAVRSCRTNIVGKDPIRNVLCGNGHFYIFLFGEVSPILEI